MEENQLLNNLDEPPNAAGETLPLLPSSGNYYSYAAINKL